jgi:hypothetical protein
LCSSAAVAETGTVSESFYSLSETPWTPKSLQGVVGVQEATTPESKNRTQWPVRVWTLLHLELVITKAAKPTTWYQLGGLFDAPGSRVSKSGINRGLPAGCAGGDGFAQHGK